MRNFKINNALPYMGRCSSLIVGLMIMFSSCVENIREAELDEVLLSSGASGNAIYDGAHGGLEGFYFLPPIARQTDFSGDFDPTLSPVVEISDDFSFNFIHAQFTMGGNGPNEIKVAGDHYHVNWNASRTGATEGTTYRIRIRLGNVVLGYVDVAVVRNAREWAPDGALKLNANQTLPIKFRIEDIDLVQPIRIELTWTPFRDLDSHLTGPIPGTEERFHIAYWDRGSETSPPFAYLTNDDTSGEFGETTLITQFFEGTYRFFVYDLYSFSEIPFSDSGARVRVYSGDDLLADFGVPQSEGVLWTVFEMDGLTREITPINYLSWDVVFYRLSTEPFQEESNLILESIKNNKKAP